MAGNNSFAEFVKESREQKRKEALAQEMLGSRGRKANGSGAGNLAKRNDSQKPTLLSRISGSGVNKPRSSSAKPTVGGSIDGKWQHDLHKLNNPGSAPAKNSNRTASASQLDRNTRTFDKFRSALQNNTQTNAPAVCDAPGFSIRGVAAGGPFTVVASNFEPGTTAADVASAMAPYGDVQSCKLISATPTVMVEIVFDSRESAVNVVSTFNNQKADGRVLYVYLKNTRNTPNAAVTNSRPAPRVVQSSFDDMDLDAGSGAQNGSFQDGRFGFNDNNQREPPRGPRRRY